MTNERIGEGATSPWTTRERAGRFSAAPGVEVRVIPGQALMTCWITLDPDTELPLHDHPNEQIGVVLEGAISVTIGDDSRRLEAGGAYTVPPGVRHGGRTGPEGCRLLESFSPPRPDYLARARGDQSANS